MVCPIWMSISRAKNKEGHYENIFFHVLHLKQTAGNNWSYRRLSIEMLNAMRQARLEGGARHERTLEAVVCKRLLGM